MEFWMLLAWLDAGLAKESLVEMRGYWGQMLRNGATTTWELVDRRIPGLDTLVVAGRSQCHGWSAGPAHLLPSRILGVTPTAPGWSERRLSGTRLMAVPLSTAAVADPAGVPSGTISLSACFPLG